MEKRFLVERQFGTGWVETDLESCLIAGDDWYGKDTNLQEIWETWGRTTDTAEQFATAWTNAYFDHFCEAPSQIRISVMAEEPVKTLDSIVFFVYNRKIKPPGV